MTTAVRAGTFVRCKHCEWSRPVWWRNGAGKARSGYKALRMHVSDDHPAEYDKLQAALDDEFGEEATDDDVIYADDDQERAHE
jgi:hypothetical protein